MKEILDKMTAEGIQGSDCSRLIKLVDLIIAGQNSPRVVVNTEIRETLQGHKEDQRIDLKQQYGKSKISLGVLSASGFNYEDIKKLQKASKILSAGELVIENDHIFNKDARPQIRKAFNTPKHPEEIKEEAENILLLTNQFLPDEIKNELRSLEESLPNKTEKKGKIMVKIDLDGKIFIDSNPEEFFTVRGKKLEILRALSEKKPKTIFELKEEVGYTVERRISTAIKEINDSFHKDLSQEFNLIENIGKGYRLSKNTYDIRILNR